MKDFLLANAAWLTPVLVAVVTGFFYLIKKGGNHNKQSIKSKSANSINQINGDNNTVK